MLSAQLRTYNNHYNQFSMLQLGKNIVLNYIFNLVELKLYHLLYLMFYKLFMSAITWIICEGSPDFFNAILMSVVWYQFNWNMWMNELCDLIA